MKKYVIVAVSAMVCGAVGVELRGAEGPATRPSGAATTQQAGPVNVPPPMPAMRRRLWEGPPPTAEQIREAEVFAEANSPNRYQAYKRFAESGQGEFRDRIRNGVVRGYLEMQAVSREDPELYEMKLNEMKLEDQIWGAVAEYRRRAESGSEKLSRADLRESIRPQFKELLELRRKQAEHRIERMEAAVREERSKLEKLKRVNDEALNARMDQEIEYGGMFRTAFGPGPGGPPGGGPPGRGGGR